MSTDTPVIEQRSTVKISQTAKGDRTVDVKVVDGAIEDEIDRIRELAVRTYRQTVDALRSAA